MSVKKPETGLVETVELTDHRSTFGLFHPEYNSTVANPNPLFMGFVKAAIENK